MRSVVKFMYLHQDTPETIELSPHHPDSPLAGQDALLLFFDRSEISAQRFAETVAHTMKMVDIKVIIPEGLDQ